jgi:DinB superfamily
MDAMTTNDLTAIREHLGRLLAWEDAHVGFDAAVDRIPSELRGKRPAKLPYSPWQLVEHLRITQKDILDFCRDPNYQERKWPEDYWPASPAPPSTRAWTESLRQFRSDRDALQRLAADPAIDLTATIPQGGGQTYLREIVLVADHTAYHVGQLVLVRRLLGIWKGS